MHPYTELMMDVVGMPRSVNIKGRAVAPEILFSPALAESMLFWYASSLSVKLHGEVLLSTRLIADPDMVSGARLVSTNMMPQLTNDGMGMGLAASAMLLAESGSRIIAPSRRSVAFDYEKPILSFREVVRRNYDAGQEISPYDIALQTVFYDTILRSVENKPAPRVSPGVVP